MNLPRFLVIGAMKAGTTTLYDDLLHADGIWMPPEKEPNDLAFPAVETPEGLSAYARKFNRCPAAAIPGDASTAYAKRPTYEGVAKRARRVLGPEVKVIYLTRDPIRRIVSQYHHLWGLELENRPLNEAVLADESYVAYSRYKWQIEPWLQEFGDNQVLTVRFEDFISNRNIELARICSFIGVDGVAQTSSAHRNASEGALVPLEKTIIGRMATSPFYLYQIKRFLPMGLRENLKRLLLPKARPMNEELCDATKRKLVDLLLSDPIARDYLERE